MAIAPDGTLGATFFTGGEDFDGPVGIRAVIGPPGGNLPTPELLDESPPPADESEQFSSDIAIAPDGTGITTAVWTVLGDGHARLRVASTATPDLPLTVSSSGSGTVRSDLGGISCGKACTASLPAYTVVVLTAAPGEGSSFIGWSGACSGSGTTCRLRMDERKDVTATFTDPPTPIGPTDPPIGPVGSVAVFDGERLHVRLKCGARFKPECNMTAVPVTRKDRKVKRVRKGRKIIQVTRGVPMAKPVKRKISAGKWVQVTFLVKPRFRATLEAMAKRKVKTLFVKQRIRSRKIGRRSFKGKPRVVWSRYLVRRVG